MNSKLVRVVMATAFLTTDPPSVLASGQPVGPTGGSAGNDIEWTDVAFSPRPALPDGSLERELSRICRVMDGALARVAGRVALGEIGADPQALSFALRRAGAPYVWPRAWSLTGRFDAAEARDRFAHWLRALRPSGQRRCGFATAGQGDHAVIAAVAVDVEADLAPLPLRVRPGTWVDFAAEVWGPTSSAKVVVAPPAGVPYGLPTTVTNGHARARVHLDRAGAFRLSLVIDGPSGPHPALEIDLFAGIEPPAAPDPSAPGESAASDPDAASALVGMLALAREGADVAPLARDPILDQLARAHAERMMRRAQLGHDVGDGDPRERLERAGVSSREIGENVAHAASPVSAHRALWSSPSHRQNMLAGRFDHVGVGVTEGADGSMWVTQIFVRRR